MSLNFLLEGFVLIDSIDAFHNDNNNNKTDANESNCPNKISELHVEIPKTENMKATSNY